MSETTFGPGGDNDSNSSGDDPAGGGGVPPPAQVPPVQAPQAQPPLVQSTLAQPTATPPDAAAVQQRESARQQAEAGDRLFWHGDFAGAWRRYQEAVRLGPASADYHWRLGLAAWKAGQVNGVEGHLREAVRLAPHFAPARQTLAQWSLTVGRLDDALAHSEAAWAVDPRDREVVLTHATVLSAAGQDRRAWELLRPVLDAAATAAGLGPAVSNPRDAVQVGAARTGAADSVTTQPDAGPSALLTARLAVFYAQQARRWARFAADAQNEQREPTGQEPDASAQGLEERRALSLVEWALRSENVPPALKPSLRFAAVGPMERAGRYDEAFEHARLAKQATGGQFNPSAHADWVSRQINYFTRERVRCLPRAATSVRRVVLIVGMPRSGTSLVEQMLASHPDVFGAGELEFLNDIRRSADQMVWPRQTLDSPPDAQPVPYPQPIPYPQSLDGLSFRDLDAMARRYFAALDSLAGLKSASKASAADAKTPLVTDKMPQNFLLLGLAQVLLPGCRVIHCVRSPMDTCLSCFLTEFSAGQAFSHDLGHLGLFYRQYRRLMAHWKKALDLPILDVRYEDLVLDVESHARRLLEFVGLDWDERCTRFHESSRPVLTASRDQVRRPAYLSSVGRWRHYEKHLGPLIESLGGHDTPDPGGSRDTGPMPTQLRRSPRW